MEITNNKNTLYILFSVLLIYIIGKVYLLDTYFFWDNIDSLSVPAHYIYETGSLDLNYPNHLSDPPFLHILLAVVWKLFGKTLLSTHILLGIFGAGSIYQLYIFCKNNTKKEYFYFIFLLALFEPAFNTQILVLCHDACLLFLALLTLNALQKKNKWLFILASVLLTMENLRGFVVCTGIGISYLLSNIYIEKNSFKKSFINSVLTFLPAILSMLFFFLYKKYTTHVYYIHPESPWKDSWNLVGIKGLLHNTLGVIRFLLDHGECFVWGTFFILLIFTKGRRTFYEANKFLFFLLGGSLFVFMILTIPFSNAFGKRYFILPSIIINIITAKLIFYTLRERSAKIVIAFLIIGLLSGHLWVYPDKLSKPWDCYLGHLPYYKLRKEAIQYLDNNKISFSEVGGFFPSTSKIENIELNGDNRIIEGVNIDKNTYILYSNIANWDDELIDEVTLKWKCIKVFEKGSVFIKLYKRPE